MKPMATLADLVDWRALARAQDIPRRPAHAPRPDRGYIDQSPPPTPRPPSVIPLERLMEAQAVSEQDIEELPSGMHQPLEGLEEPREGVMQEQGPSTVGQAMLELAQQQAAPPAPPSREMTEEDEPFEDYHEGNPGKRVRTPEFKAQVAEAWQKALDERTGETQEQIAARFGVHQSSVSSWWRARYEVAANAQRRTGPSGRVTTTEEYRRDLVRKFIVETEKDPKLSHTEFCNREDVQSSTFSYWLKQYGDEERQKIAKDARAAATSQTITSVPSEPVIPPSVPGKRRVFSEADKRAILAANQDLGSSQLAEKYGLSSSLPGMWRNAYGHDGRKGLRKAPAQKPTTSVFPPTSKPTNGKRELEDIVLEIQQLKQEMSERAVRLAELKREMVAAVADD